VWPLYITNERGRNHNLTQDHYSHHAGDLPRIYSSVRTVAIAVVRILTIHGIMVYVQQLDPPALTARSQTIGLQFAVDSVHSVETQSDGAPADTTEYADETNGNILRISALQTTLSLPCDKWRQALLVSGKQVTFRIDTGARCNTMTLSDYQRLDHTGELRQSTKVLCTYSNHKLKPVAAVDLPVQYRGKLVTPTFEVVALQQENIISGNTAEALGLIIRLDSVATEVDTCGVLTELKEYPDLVRTTGTLPGMYTIKLQSGAKGVVHASRRQPASLLPRIKTRLGGDGIGRIHCQSEQTYGMGQFNGGISQKR